LISTTSWRLLALSVALTLASVAATPAHGQADQALGAAPVHIDIPKIGAHASVVPLGEDADGTMQAPSDPDTVGWYELGTGIGTPGNALLDGHVDWAGRLRSFGLLRTLEPGDAVQLTDADGYVLGYTVRWIKLYEADAAPLDEIFDPTSDEEITLITCGGAFDPSIHMYVSRWIVRAVRTS
jgi:sortase A